MSAGDLTEATSTRGFKPEFHSWILIPDTASFRKESSEEDPTNAPSPDGCPEATATSEEAPETSTVNAESIILGATTIGGLCSSLPTSPLASSCDLSSSAGSELLIPSWPLALPRDGGGAPSDGTLLTSVPGTLFVRAPRSVDASVDSGKPSAVATARFAAASRDGILTRCSR